MPKGLAALLMRKKSEKGAPGDSGAPDLGAEAKELAAADALAAFKSGDADALSDALERHYRACRQETEPEGDEPISDEAAAY